NERIIALDVLRGISVLGILLMNIVAFGLPNAYYDPTQAGGAEGVNLLIWGITSLSVEGVFRGLFTLLFGAGVVLYTQRLERAGTDSVVLYYRRTLWLIVFGLLDAYLLLWYGDILFLYGLVGLILYLFRHLRVSRLLCVAIPLLCPCRTIMGLQTYKEFTGLQNKAIAFQQERAEGNTLSRQQQQKIEHYEAWVAYDTPTAEDQAETIEGKRGSYASAFETTSEEFYFMQTEYLFPQGILEVLGMMLLGMALVKTGFLTAQWSKRRYLWVLGLGWGIGLLVNGFETIWQIQHRFELKALMLATTVTYDLSHSDDAGACCSHYADGSQWLVKGLLHLFACTGQMALTNYLAQSLIALFLFTGAGRGLVWAAGTVSTFFTMLYSLCGCFNSRGAIYGSLFSFWSYGVVWRSLTRWQRQPIRRNVSLLLTMSASALKINK
ncbi:MAG: DUF418 domain-containing protein, partial [Hahellaceae bacterium]|nr:DUF418 domain-containing protein [Hahellaceae bacterium]